MKILIVKLGAAGDVLRTTAILPGLVKKFKNPDVLPEEFTGTHKRRDMSLKKWEKIRSLLN